MTLSGAISARIRARSGTCSGPWASRPLALIDQAVPAAIRITEPLPLAEAKNERQTLSYLRRMRDRNRVFISMLGAHLGPLPVEPGSCLKYARVCRVCQCGN